MTGATGYIGGAVAAELRHHGHEVAALVRPESESRALRDLGVVIIAGDLDSLPTFGDALDGYDCYIHAAVASENTAERARAALDAIRSRNAHFIYTSGVWSLGNTTDADENTPPNPLPISAWRIADEDLAVKSGGAVLRPGCVYGGRQSLLAKWFAAAEQNQPIEIVGDGTNQWSMINLHDLASCYVTAAEQRATGILHATDDTHVALNDCARALAPNSEIHHVEMSGPFADALKVNQIVRSDITRQRLGWTPKRTFTSSLEEQWREWRESRSAAR